MDLLSVITASFNSEKSIVNTMDSILTQEHRPLEYIIIDGNSTDNTCQLIKSKESSFADAGIKLKWQSEPDNGIYDAWNKGLAIATGNWISFLGSDDIYYPKSLSYYYEAIEKNKNSDFVTAKTRIKKENKLIRNFGQEWSWHTFKKEMKILHAGGFLNKNYIDQYGAFDETYKITGDYELLLRKGNELRVEFIDKFLVEMDGGGVSNSELKNALLEARRAKIETAKRSKILANMEMYVVLMKIQLKSILS